MPHPELPCKGLCSEFGLMCDEMGIAGPKRRSDSLILYRASFTDTLLVVHTHPPAGIHSIALWRSRGLTIFHRAKEEQSFFGGWLNKQRKLDHLDWIKNRKRGWWARGPSRFLFW